MTQEVEHIGEELCLMSVNLAKSDAKRFNGHGSKEKQ